MALRKSTGFTSMRSALLCSALAIPALAPAVAFAQDQAETCMTLEQTAEQIDFEQSDISEEEFNQVVQANDPAQCESWLVQLREEAGTEGEVSETERARVRLEDEVVIEGRVIVDQPQPQVDVEEQAAEVVVGRSTSDVNVTQGPIDIVIRQGAPLVRLDMPQPTVTIEQPAPEIIVTMPDPSVDVANSRPTIEVRQAEPRVQVTMAEPTIELDLYQAEDAENSPGIAVEQRQAQDGADGASPEPEVTMQRAEAQVIYQDSEEQQANVSHSRSEPNIRFEQAEAQVEITSSGEPQVNWTQSGEPTVRFEESAGQEAGQEADPQSAAQGQTETSEMETGQAESGQAESGQMEQAETGAPNVRREGYEAVEIDQVEMTDLGNATVYGVQDNEVGEAGQLIEVDEQAQTAIVDVGAALGTEERRVEIPFSDMTLLRNQDGSDLRVYIDASEERLMGYPEAE